MLKNMSAQMLRYGSILEKQRKRAQSGARLHLSSIKPNKYDHHHYGLDSIDNSDAIALDKLSQIRKERKRKVGMSQDFVSLKSASKQAGLPVIKSNYETGGGRQIQAKVAFRKNMLESPRSSALRGSSVGNGLTLSRASIKVDRMHSQPSPGISAAKLDQEEKSMKSKLN